MNDQQDKKIFANIDPFVQKQEGYSVEPESNFIQDYPKSFPGIKTKIIKSVSLYLQLLWDSNPNGKTIKVIDIIQNARMLFGTKYQTKNIYVIRHIAADLREIEAFSGLKDKIERYFKNIDIQRLDIEQRIVLSDLFYGYFSEVVHFNFDKSYERLEKLNQKLTELGSREIDVPSSMANYIDKRNFDSIFEEVSIAFIMNYYAVFQEFLFNEDKEK